MKIKNGHRLLSLVIVLVIGSTAHADPPSTAYMFPAGGQRGTTVRVRVGGNNLHESAAFFIDGRGMKVPKRIRRGKTLFFEGPVIPMPASQAKENYPKDYDANLTIAANAKTGNRRWRVATSQGISASRIFVVGDLAEIVEREIDGDPIPTGVKLPVTINGRIFPREDIDVWTFTAKEGETITCEVNAARIGSPLDSRLEVRGPAGQRIAENVDAQGTDSRLSFTAPANGRFAVHIHDVNFRGLQSYVYRLTITAGPMVESIFPLGGRRGETVTFQLVGADLPTNTVKVALPKSDRPFFEYRAKTATGFTNPVRIEMGDNPEFTERRKKTAWNLPAVFNGRILAPGEIDEWKVVAKKGDALLFDLKAARLGSRLDSVLTVTDSKGKTLGTSDDIGGGQTDSQLRLKIPADGEYAVRISDRLKTRGGSAFGYRLAITKATTTAAGFRVVLPTDAVTVNRGLTAKLKINVERLGGFREEIELQLAGLAKGVTVTGTKIAKNKNNTQLVFTTTESTTIGVSQIRISGKAVIDGKPVVVAAETVAPPGQTPGRELWLAVAMPTPFKFSGIFETKYGSRGSVFTRHYSIERGDFQGPLTVMLADVQARHLQGVTGPSIELPPGTKEFDYPITMPPWMEIGRTSRTCLMLVGTVIDADGKMHRVSYSSQAQNDQIIVLVDPGRLSIRSVKKSVRAIPGGTVSVPVEVARGNGLVGPIKIEVIVPAHLRGLSAATVTIPEGSKSGKIALRFARKFSSEINMPITIRATLGATDSQKRLYAEAPLAVVTD